MKILIHGINYSPELIGVGKYTGEMGAWLAEEGHEVRAVVAPPYYPEWRVGARYHAWRYKVETISGVRVFRCPIFVPSSPNGFSRVLHLLSFAVFSFPVMLGQIPWHPDLVIVIEPTFTAVPQALLVARIVGAKAWLHIQDFEIDAAFRLGILGGSRLYGKSQSSRVVLARALSGIVGWFESFIMRRFDRVSTISRSMKKGLVTKGIPHEQTTFFPNWIDTKSYTNDAIEQIHFENYQEISKTEVLYAGNMGEKQGLEQILVVATNLAKTHPGIRFTFCGEGTSKSRLEAESSRLKLPNVRFLPLQTNEAFPRLLASADIHLVLQRRGAADLVMPSKLAGIFAVAGAAIVTAEAGTELHTLITGLKTEFTSDSHLMMDDHGELGVVIPPESAIALEKAILTLLVDPEKRKRLGSNAKLYADTHLLKLSVLSRFAREVSELVRGP